MKWALCFHVFSRILIIITTLKFRPLKSEQGARLTKKKWFIISEKTKKEDWFYYGHYVISITKQCYLLSFTHTKYTHFGKNLIHKVFLVLSSVSFVPLVRFNEYMCLTLIILNLSSCQPFSHTFHWTKINSLS